MVRRRFEWLLCLCALVAAVGYVHGHLLVDRSAKQRVQALLAHQNPISALRTSAPVSPLASLSPIGSARSHASPWDQLVQSVAPPQLSSRRFNREIG
ncbi:hypothetical protein MTO96_001991 [Rhipicephalus appendiculatus]